MTPEIIAQLRARMQTQPRPLSELHRTAAAAGSAWSEEQVALLLSCLPDVDQAAGAYRISGRDEENEVARALLDLVSSTPTPAGVLISRMPRSIVTTAAALCEIARRHPELELIGSNRIRRR